MFYLIGPGLRHSWRNDGRHTAATLSLLLDTAHPGHWPVGAGIHSCCRDLAGRVGSGSLTRFSTTSDRELHHSYWLAADHLTAEQPREPLVLVGVLLALLGQVRERIGGARPTVPADLDAAQTIRRLLLARVRDRLSLGEIAREVGMSTTRAKEVFRAAFDCGIMTYFNHLKIWQAKRLLADPALSVEQVGHELGFSSASYFGRAFLKHTGKTPSEYRRGEDRKE
ncbi:MAG: hypothetical protein JWO38_8356 [Gemmataceae bacterium]|nr:hypothetical protein [Gemmataceae bacterium]